MITILAHTQSALENLPLLLLVFLIIFPAGFALGALWKHIFQRIDERRIFERGYRACEDDLTQRDLQLREQLGDAPPVPAGLAAEVERGLQSAS